MSTIKVTLQETRDIAGAVEFTVTNLGNKTIRFLKWGTPFDEVEGDCLNVRLNGLQSCDYLGRQYKRLYDEELSTIVLQPKQSLKRSIHIAAWWSLPAQGAYEVSLKSTHFKVINSTQPFDKNASPRLSARKIASKPITIFVENPFGFTEEFASASDYLDAPRNFSPDEIDHLRSDKSPVPVCPPLFLCVVPTYANKGECFMTRYIGHPKMASGTKDQGTIKNYADLMKRALAYMLSIRGDWNFQNDKTYRKWFGAYTPQRAERVATGLNRALSAISCFNFVFYIDNSSPPDVVAWWRKSTDPKQLSAMGFCGAYFKLRDGGMNSKMGSIGHELTHAFAGTKDHVYGMDKCMQLAKNTPDLAIENADNYEYFMEEKINLQPI